MAVITNHIKAPKIIVKPPIIDEGNTLYRNVILPCLERNTGKDREQALVHSICHLPKDELSSNDLNIFLSACKKGGFGIQDYAKFIRDLASECVKENNEKLFLQLLAIEEREGVNGQGVLQGQDIDVLFWGACENGWGISLKALFKLGANATKKNPSDKTPLQILFSSQSFSEPTSYKAAVVLIENGADTAGLQKKLIIDFLSKCSITQLSVMKKCLRQNPHLIADTRMSGFLNSLVYEFESNRKNQALAKFLEELLDKGAKFSPAAKKSLLNSCISYVEYIDFAAKIIFDPRVVLNQEELDACLRIACACGGYSLVEELLKRGANPNQKDKYGSSAFNTLLLNKRKEVEQIALLLKKYGGDPHQKNNNGYSSTFLMHENGLPYASLFPLNQEEEEMLQKKICGHVSSVSSISEDEFERSKGPVMAAEIAESLKDFFVESEEQNPEVRKELVEAFELAAKQIDPEAIASRIQNGHPTVLPVGWKEHGISLVFLPDPEGTGDTQETLVAICNRGMGITDPSDTLKVFRCNPKKITPELIQMMKDGTTNWTAQEGFNFYFDKIAEILFPLQGPLKDDFCFMLQNELASSLQKVNNCSYASLKAALRFLWAGLLYKARKSKSPDIAKEAKQKTKRWSLSAQLYRLEKYNAFLHSIGRRFLHKDDRHYFSIANKKIKKRLTKMPGFARAKARYETLLETTFLKRVDPVGFICLEAERMWQIYQCASG